MAKKNKPGALPVWLLLLIAMALLAGGWLMKSFPVLIFAAYAPLLAIADRTKEKEAPWNHLELILLALSFSFLCAHFFDFNFLMIVLAQGILFTLVFAGYHFTFQNLGNRTGKFTVIIFWLGLEYVLLKTPWRQDFSTVADALQLQPSWWRWNIHTGYLGLSLWVWIVNLIFYHAVFRTNQFNWMLFMAGLLAVAGPSLYSSVTMNTPAINREQMIALYSNTTETLNVNYANRGEFVTRTAAWLSVLILLLALVKNIIRK
jgi:hypothetical protein